jgi:3-phosphoshikimate 1-carboxyvinyltransferase
VTRLCVRPTHQPLRGNVSLPSDKSIGHRALMLAALATGRSRLQGFSYGEDNLATLRALRQMGVLAQDDAAGTLLVQGVGLGGLRAPQSSIDCGNSGTSMRLLTGLLAAQCFGSELVGDESRASKGIRTPSARRW